MQKAPRTLRLILWVSLTSLALSCGYVAWRATRGLQEAPQGGLVLHLPHTSRVEGRLYADLPQGGQYILVTRGMFCYVDEEEWLRASLGDLHECLWQEAP